MADNRTFKFYGQGYGSSNVSIVAKINSTVVFSGEIPTIALAANSVQPTPLPTDQVVLFSINNSSALNTDFAGSLPMTIDITGGESVLFGNIESNYYEQQNSAVYTADQLAVLNNPDSTPAEINAIIIPLANPPFNDTELAFLNLPTYDDAQIQEFYALLVAHNIPVFVSSGPDNYTNNYTGSPVNSEETPDPRSSVTINGNIQVPPQSKSTGTWNWYVPTGNTLGYNWNISVGFANGASIIGNVSNYTGDYATFVKSS